MSLHREARQMYEERRILLSPVVWEASTACSTVADFESVMVVVMEFGDDLSLTVPQAATSQYTSGRATDHHTDGPLICSFLKWLCMEKCSCLRFRHYGSWFSCQARPVYHFQLTQDCCSQPHDVSGRKKRSWLILTTCGRTQSLPTHSSKETARALISRFLLRRTDPFTTAVRKSIHDRSQCHLWSPCQLPSSPTPADNFLFNRARLGDDFSKLQKSPPVGARLAKTPGTRHRGARRQSTELKLPVVGYSSSPGRVDWVLLLH